jgi:uncharacterized protein (DUF58 family)
MTRLTRQGWLVAAAAPVLVVAGLLGGYTFLAGIGYAAAVAVAGAIAITLARYAIVASREVLPDRVTAGGEVRMRLTVSNLRSLPTPGFAATVHMGRLGTIELPVPPLGPRGQGEASTVITASRRGLIRLSPVAVRRRDPLGLAQRDAGFSDPAWLWIHPRVHHLAPLPAGLMLDFEGRAVDMSHAGSATFASLREYAEGDDPRHIHWRTTARTGILTVRQHVDTTEPSAVIAIDTSTRTLGPETFEEAVEVAASIAAASARAGRPFTLAMPGQTQDAGSHDYLDRLAALDQTGGHLDELVAAVEQAPGGGSLVAISGDGADLLGAISSQRRRFAMVVAILVGAQRSAMSRRPGMTVVTLRAANELPAVWSSVLRSAT